jgi:hypothetical protein
LLAAGLLQPELAEPQPQEAPQRVAALPQRAVLRWPEARL